MIEHSGVKLPEVSFEILDLPGSQRWDQHGFCDRQTAGTLKHGKRISRAIRSCSAAWRSDAPVEKKSRKFRSQTHHPLWQSLHTSIHP